MSKGSRRRPEDAAAVAARWPFGAAAAPHTFVTGTGQRLTSVHVETAECAAFGCVIHAPTDLTGFPTHFRDDTGLMERVCPHGVGHPDVDSVAWFERNGRPGFGVHGCDGCCDPARSNAAETAGS